METNEAEVLAKAYGDAYSAMWASGGNDKHACHEAGLLAVAAKARELDAARGGTLSVEALENIGLVLDANPTVEWSPKAMRRMIDHAASQGRTISAKDARIAELEASERALMASVLGTVGGMVEGAPTGPHNFLQRLRELMAAESALATLRQAAQEVVGTHAKGFLLAPPMAALRKALAATPAENPDTATLRAIRERARDRKTLGTILSRARLERGTYWLGTADDVAAYLLGDSSPSGGGECCGGGRRDSGCGSCPGPSPVTPETVTVVRNALGLPPEPTTPPDVAASEHPVTKAARESMERGGAKWLAGGMDSPTPTPEEDWRTVEEAVATFACHPNTSREDVAEMDSALARLKDAPRRTAEEMRERCASLADASASDALRRRNTADVSTPMGRTVYQTAEAQWDVAAPLADDIRALEVTP